MGNKTFFYKMIPLLLLFFLCPSLLYAQSGDQSLTLNSLVKEALALNPEILSAKNAFESASARIPQAASFNDPAIEFEYDKITADRNLSGNPMKTFSVSQDIPFPTKLYLRAKIASKLAKMAYENYKAKERDVISRLKSAYFELALIYKAIEIDKENKDILDQLSKTATKRYGAGQGTQADALKAQVELARFDNELILLEQKRVTAQAKLNALLNRDPKSDFGIPLAEPPIRFSRTLDDFYRLTLDNNPELKVYRYAIDRGQAAYDLSRNEFMPDFTVRFKQMVDKGRAEDGAWAGMVGVTIPLWFFQKQSFGVKEMKSDLAMVKAEYKGKENSVLFELNDAYARAVANKKLVELYETAFIPQARESVSVAFKGYEAEKTDFLTVLDSQRMLINFKLDHYKAILDLRIALADLERTVGIDIDF
ncbi:MAG TPA: TolC family protein [Candidatus Omnitrophota bacterium]|nr:TolC family protein [Candidatus Omnitrophota bacterium]HPD84284.1 TolC family protein [Candidatus Omnitrophota bacterium]HRZ03141.1 TolC family protein [Candidatus Omnitrophota bacterium]